MNNKLKGTALRSSVAFNAKTFSSRPRRPNLRPTDEMTEVHIQSLPVGKIRVHPTAVEDDLGHTLLDHLVILRPVIKRTSTAKVRGQSMTRDKAVNFI